MLAPLDYAKPDGTAITLMVAKRPGEGDEHLGSLIINPGGPGGSGVGYVGYFDAAGLEDYDIVGWDPRGVGRSTPVTCWGQADLDRLLLRWTAHPMTLPSYRPESTSRPTLAARASTDQGRCWNTSRQWRQYVILICCAGWSGTPSSTTSVPLTAPGSAHSMPRCFPQRVGRMILDGAVDVNSNSKITQVDGFERALAPFRALVRRSELSDGVAAGRRDLCDQEFS